MENKVKNLLSDKQALFLQFALFFMLQGLVSVAFTFFKLNADENSSLITIEFSLFLQQFLIFGTAAWVTLRLQGEKPPVNFNIQPTVLLIAIVGLLGAMAITPFIMIPKETIQNFSPEIADMLIEIEEKVEAILNKLFKNENIFILIFLIGLVPAIFEELFFRGVLLKNLLRVMPPFFAIILNGFIFSLIHGQIFGFFPRWLLGSFFDVVFYKTRNLIYTIILHFVFNSTSLLISVYVAKDTNWEEKEMPVYLLIGGMVLLFLSIFGLLKTKSNE